MQLSLRGRRPVSHHGQARRFWNSQVHRRSSTSEDPSAGPANGGRVGFVINGNTTGNKTGVSDVLGGMEHPG